MGQLTVRSVGQGMHFANHGRPKEQHEVKREMMTTSKILKAAPLLQHHKKEWAVRIGIRRKSLD
jgi:hypothetical protein